MIEIGTLCMLLSAHSTHCQVVVGRTLLKVNKCVFNFEALQEEKLREHLD